MEKVVQSQVADTCTEKILIQYEEVISLDCLFALFLQKLCSLYCYTCYTCYNSPILVYVTYKYYHVIIYIYIIDSRCFSILVFLVPPIFKAFLEKSGIFAAQAAAWSFQTKGANTSWPRRQRTPKPEPPRPRKKNSDKSRSHGFVIDM